jgi:branched-chain amino acid transport system ATP-binding protein
MLEVEDLSVAYGGHVALHGVSLAVEAGESVVILGANGAGKSTMLRAIGGVQPARAGSHIRLDGADIAGQEPHSLVESGIALVPEGRGLFAAMTVRENLELGAFARRARGRERTRREEVFALFPRLAERLGQLARTLSGGEQQMLAIGRALMSCPAYLLLDEPSLGLSPALSGELFRALAAVGRTGVGILLVEQNARLSLAICRRGYILANGRVVGAGTAEALSSDPAVARSYLGL